MGAAQDRMSVKDQLLVTARSYYSSARVRRAVPVSSAEIPDLGIEIPGITDLAGACMALTKASSCTLVNDLFRDFAVP